MKFSNPLTRNARKSPPPDAHWDDLEGVQHPDLPLHTPPLSQTRPQHGFSRRAPVNNRYLGHAGGSDRRSIAAIPDSEFDQDLGFYSYHSPDDFATPPPRPPDTAGLPGGRLARSQTISRREGARSRHIPIIPFYDHQSQNWSLDFSRLLTPSEQYAAENTHYDPTEAPMSGATYNTAPLDRKTSSDSGQGAALDRWSQRRLQRLNTEQGFREQRQGGHLSSSPLPGDHASYSNTTLSSYSSQDTTQPQGSLQQSSQPHSVYQTQRTGLSGNANAGLAIQALPNSNLNVSRSPSYPQQSDQTHGPQQQTQSQYSPPDSSSSYQLASADPSRPQLHQTRSYLQQQQTAADDQSMSSNNGGLPAPTAVRTGAGPHRQSVHNGMRDKTVQQQPQQQPGVPAFNPAVVPPSGQSQNYKGSQQQGDVGRVTPQPVQTSEDMSEEDVNQLLKDHKELREKYTKVKKYYFEKEDQVKQLQNSLAHQRLSQSRTSLDDSEYTTRFNRLDGLVAQLAFSIRKSWRSIPHWLDKSANKDAVSIGKQEMTAVGRAIISYWLVEEVFNKYFHPDLDPSLSAHLKTIQLNIRRFAPPAQTVEEEEFLTSKVVNWRLSTLEGLQDALRSPQCPANRAQLTEMLKQQLIRHLAVYLQDPPPSDLEGGVHMIVELVVSIAIHLPVESRDVVIEYFMPGYSIVTEQMKLESGIPPLNVSIADDAAERASMKSVTSDMTEMTEGGHGEKPQKRSMLSAITGSGKPKGQAHNKNAASGSSSSLHRPDSSQGTKEDLPPRVRMSAGIGVQIRGRAVLVKAPVFST
ncbi:Protein of unknown function (DUF1348) [Teratosphaeria destructans]|uniref:Uncharacterized protein n=1 Tax=Teratosphaeria destructans TaxID=418781 RepID=A0A9W7SLD7_9PEZI|nr:Protein of unknown function (DUF1348) [Teratosphaeria destructans]